MTEAKRSGSRDRLPALSMPIREEARTIYSPLRAVFLTLPHHTHTHPPVTGVAEKVTACRCDSL